MDIYSPTAKRKLRLEFNENGNMFYLTNKHGDVVDWMCSRHLTTKPNECWLEEKYHSHMELNSVVKAPMDPNLISGPIVMVHEGVRYVFCNIVHPEFNDNGYSPFGDFCRSRLGQQCQYGSRYIDGRLEGYPNLGEGLRFCNRGGEPLDATDYHFVRIHRDDMDEFERRYKAYQAERLG